MCNKNERIAKEYPRFIEINICGGNFRGGQIFW